MKRRDFIRQLETSGCVLIYHGEKHDWHHNPVTKVSQPVPRHTEINEHLAKRRIGLGVLFYAFSITALSPASSGRHGEVKEMQSREARLLP